MRGARIVLAAVAVALVACRDVPAPEGGVASLGRVQLPSPGLVIGDTLRDSLGNAAPLRIVAFDQRGDTIAPAPEPTFVVLDPNATLTNDFLIGTTAGPARVVALVSGLQSRVDTVLVTTRPDTIVPLDAVRFVRSVNFASTDTSFTASDLAVLVRDASDAGVDAVVVTYTLVRSPAGHPDGAGPTVVFAGGTTTPVKDSTSGGGRAARTIRLRKLAQPLIADGDSAIVNATASYRGQSLGTVQFTIVFQLQ